MYLRYFGESFIVFIVVLKINRFFLFILRFLFLFLEFYVLIYSFVLFEGWIDYIRFMCIVYCYVGLINVMFFFFYILN